MLVLVGTIIFIALPNQSMQESELKETDTTCKTTDKNFNSKPSYNLWRL